MIDWKEETEQNIIKFFSKEILTKLFGDGCPKAFNRDMYNVRKNIF